MKTSLAVPLLLMGTLNLLAGPGIVAQIVPQHIRVDQKVMSAQIVTKIAPAYPPLARQAHIQGAVALRVQISKTGDVTDVQLISGHPILAPSAIEAVKQWKYKPFQLNGEPVSVETNVTVNFTLSDKPPDEGVVGDGPGGIPAGEPGRLPSSVISSNPTLPRIATPQRVRVSQRGMSGLLIHKVQPEYPADAKDQHIQGVVSLRANIDKEGNVSNLELISGDPMLAPAAIEAVKQWKYRPYLLNGEPIAVDTAVTVNFTLAP